MFIDANEMHLGVVVLSLLLVTLCPKITLLLARIALHHNA